jgi:glutamate 5-kinase
MERNLGRLRRVVVKVGTSSLTRPGGLLDPQRMAALVRQLAELHRDGIDLILVTSGAVGAGMGRLGMKDKGGDLTGKQALAAIGQGLLMQHYAELFGAYDQVVGQVLLTRQDLEDPHRRESAAATMERLLWWRAIPVVNENDTVTSEEIRVGDNDTLSARVAVLVQADLLILLSDVEGFYPGDPRQNPDLRPLEQVALTKEVWQAAGGAGTLTGTGGMVTKLEAARICLTAGIPVVLARAGRPGVLRDIVEGRPVGTLFTLPEGAAAGVRPGRD